jgi:hypothetical protein
MLSTICSFFKSARLKGSAVSISDALVFAAATAAAAAASSLARVFFDFNDGIHD